MLTAGVCVTHWDQGPFQYKDNISRYEDSHYKDEAALRMSYLYNGDFYTGKMTS